MVDLQDLRNEIDSIDRQMTELFEKRMEISRKVAEYKISTGKKVFDKEREKKVIEKAKKAYIKKHKVKTVKDSVALVGYKVVIKT